MKLNRKKYLEISVVLFSSIIIFLLWNTPYLFPIKSLVVLFHEISHGMAAFFTGGRIEKILLTYSLGGSCIIEGGNPLIISSAGYLGSLLFGLIIYKYSSDKKYGIVINSILSIFLVIITASFIKTNIGIIITLFYALLFFVSPRWFPPNVNEFIMKIIGFISCAYVLYDIKSDLLTTQIRNTDAQMIADITGVKAYVWGILWALIALYVIYFLVIRNLLKK